jgi:hypothetical protein
MRMSAMVACVTVLSSSMLSKAVCPGRNGWFVKMSPRHTEANHFDLLIGAGHNKRSHHSWKSWRSGQPAESDLRLEFLYVDEFWVQGHSVPIHGNAHRLSMCIGYSDIIARKMIFDEVENLSAGSRRS